MNEINITLPPVPSINHLYFNCHGRRAMTSQGKKWKIATGMLALSEREIQEWDFSKDEKLIMEFRIFWVDKRRRDADNIVKIIQDSFTNILYEDDRWVLPRVLNWNVDKANPRVEIKLFKLNGKGGTNV